MSLTAGGGYTVKETALALGLQPGTISGMIEEGKISNVQKVGGAKRIPASEVRRLQAEERLISEGRSPADIAGLLRVSQRTVSRWCKLSHLARLTRKGYRVRPADLKKFIKEFVKEL